MADDRVTEELTTQPESPAPRAVSRAVVLGLGVGIPTSVVFLWLAVRDASLDEVWSVVRSADLAPLGLALLAVAGVYVLQAARWRRIAASNRPGVLGFSEMVVGAVACNNVLPGRIGELFRARWLAVAAPMPSGRALATVGLDRGSDVLALFVLLVVALPFVASAAWVTRILLGTTALLVALGILLVLARAYARLRHRDRHGRGRFRRIARDVVDTLAQPVERRRVAVALLLSVAAWGAFGVAVWLAGRSVDVELSALECVFVTAVINLGVAIPSSPGFVGTYQWLAVAALGVFDVPREEALAFSILLHASWWVPTTILGGVLVPLRLGWGLGRRA